MTTIEYKDNEIAEIAEGETATLLCDGMVMAGNVKVTSTGSGSVFIATYGQTSFSDMMSAWKSGKNVILKGDVESALTIRMLVHVTPSKIFFGRVLAEAKLVEEVIVSSDNKWTLIKNNYISSVDYAPRTITKVFQTTSSGAIRCETNKTYTIYCTGDTQATIRGYGNQNTDSSGNQHEISGKYLTVYCGGQYDTFDDGEGNQLSNNGAGLWYATAMTEGTITPIGAMNVRRGVCKHPDGDQFAVISYPSGCSIVINETTTIKKYFMVGEKEYYFDENTTDWSSWLSSKYNTDGFTVSSDGGPLGSPTVCTSGYYAGTDGQYINVLCDTVSGREINFFEKSPVIIAGRKYESVPTRV